MTDTVIKTLAISRHYFKQVLQAAEAACRIWEMEWNETSKDAAQNGRFVTCPLKKKSSGNNLTQLSMKMFQNAG